MKQLLNTLYVFMPQTYLRLAGETLCVEVEKEKRLQVPLLHLSSLACFGDIMITPALIHRCAEDGRSIILFDTIGRFKARIEGPVSGNILLRQAQYQSASDPVKSLNIAGACIAGKLRNARQILLRGARESTMDGEQKILVQVAESIGNAIRRIPQVKDLDILRGIEGSAARDYFQVLNYVIKPEFREVFNFAERSRRPPKDRFNALISFLYALQMNDCRSALEGVGLDPQLGYLHTVRPGRAALALDLMEEFRAVMADRLAITLINRKQINANDFEERTPGAVYLNENGRKIVAVAYQNRKQEELIHPLLNQKVPIGLLPHLQARFLARTLRGDIEQYIPFLSK